MESMSKAEVQTLDNEMLLRWLTYLSRFRAEDIGLHHDANGNLVAGDRRPKIEDVEDELVRRGLDSNGNTSTKSNGNSAANAN
ncbi:MAG: hypothetical protein EOP07_05375 [Proteobacteria bacterium]|nr:MAG: hypothetical protein EOP07_05375 [Pseudomonadota bacterium]